MGTLYSWCRWAGAALLLSGCLGAGTTSRTGVPQVASPTLVDGRAEIPLPEPFAAVETAGCGRFLVFTLKESRKLAVFDLRKLAITRSPDGFSQAGHWAQPTADGRLLLRSGGQFYTGDLQRVAAGAFDGSLLLPSDDPRFFLALRRDGGKTRVDICATQDRRSVAGIEDLKAFFGADLPRDWGEQTRQPRLRLLPSAKVLVLLPAGNRSVVVRRLDIRALVAAGGECQVVSLPPLRARRGSDYRYDLDAWSPAGGLRFELETGPPGMRVSRHGSVTWSVPAGLTEDRVPVIVSVKDKAGSEALHSFDLSIDGAVSVQ